MECTNDEWRMFYYKVMPCRKHYSHDWSDCPYSHDGEKAQRRCPRTHQYTGLSCPDMKKNGECPRGDKCHFSHNSFEYWLHPSRYRSQFCTFGTSCRRPVCFFAHTVDELRMPNTPTSRSNRPAAIAFAPYPDCQDSSSSDFMLSSGSSSPVNDAFQMPGSFSPQQQQQQLLVSSAMSPNAHLMSPINCEALSGSELGGTPPTMSTMSSYMYSGSPETVYSFLPEQQGLQYLVPESGSMGFDEFMAAAEQQVHQRIQQQQQQQLQQVQHVQQQQQVQPQLQLQPCGGSQATRLPHPASTSILRSAATSNQGLLLRRQAASIKAARPAYCAGDMMAMQELYGSSAWPLQAA